MTAKLTVLPGRGNTAPASGAFGGLMALVGAAIVLTVAVWFVKLMLSWLLAAAGIAAAVRVTCAVRRFLRRRGRRALVPAPLPAAAPRTTVTAVRVRAAVQAADSRDDVSALSRVHAAPHVVTSRTADRGRS